ncbi:MAG: glucosaminidase domain-containing protein [Hyphomicrobiaceae bacterium]|nr:glucosaminidase domain-containing protein [Hyphomicrobiaceae bacterium]
MTHTASPLHISVGKVPAMAGAITALALLAAAPLAPASAQSLPEIRLSDRNKVPACVTPSRLMRFLTERNPNLPAKFRNIAAYYKEHGERTGVRWDYAFFQMIIETNYLIFKNAAGKGDVSPNQNNFAGIGTTGGGVPGDSFPDVPTGVLGQMQHLVAYSGEAVPNPVARRTREKQDDIIAKSLSLRRAVTFRDLAGRWAVDRKYGGSIAYIAERYRSRFCTGSAPDDEPKEPAAIVAKVAPTSSPRPAAPEAPPEGSPRRRGGTMSLAVASVAGGVARPALGLVAAPAPAKRPAGCKVFTASYGGEKNVLIRRRVGDEMHYTALQVVDGREQGLADTFIRSHAPGGEALAQFPNRETALSRAFDLCPGAAGRSG